MLSLPLVEKTKLRVSLQAEIWRHWRLVAVCSKPVAGQLDKGKGKTGLYVQHRCRVLPLLLLLKNVRQLLRGEGLVGLHTWTYILDLFGAFIGQECGVVQRMVF